MRQTLIILFLFSCLSLQAKSSNCFSDSIPQKFQARLVVSFNSICCGINAKKHNDLLRFLKKYPTVTYSKINWGKQGELDYCFKLSELKPEEQERFIKKVKKLLGADSRFITIQENISCPR